MQGDPGMSDVFKWDADGQNIKMRGATGKADGKHVSSLLKLLSSDMKFSYQACTLSVVRRVTQLHFRTRSHSGVELDTCMLQTFSDVTLK